MPEHLHRMPDQPLYQQLALKLCARIEDQTYQPGMAIPSVRVLAKQHKVSYVTARQAVGELVRKGLVENQQGKGAFVRALPVRMQGASIAVLMPAALDVSTNPYMSTLVNAIKTVCEAAACGTQIYLTRDGILQAQDYETVAHLIDTGRLAGLLLIAPINDELLQTLCNRRIPIVSVHEHKRILCHTVMFDMRELGYEMTRQALAVGHRRIALLCHTLDHGERPYLAMSNLLYEGYLQAFAEAGLTTDPRLVLECTFDRLAPPQPDGDPATINSLTTRMAEQRATAYLADRHALLFAGRRALARLGLAVPADVSLLSVREGDLDPAYSGMNISGVQQASAAADRLLRLIKGEFFPTHRQLLRGTWHAGASLAPPAAAKS